MQILTLLKLFYQIGMAKSFRVLTNTLKPLPYRYILNHGYETSYSKNRYIFDDFLRVIHVVPLDIFRRKRSLQLVIKAKGSIYIPPGRKRKCHG